MAEIVLPRAPKPSARSLVVATRLPPPGMIRTGTGAFDALGDVVADCDMKDDNGKPCGWHAQGPRSQVKLAVAEHRRLFHAEIVTPYVILLNNAGRGF